VRKRKIKIVMRVESLGLVKKIVVDTALVKDETELGYRAGVGRNGSDKFLGGVGF